MHVTPIRGSTPRATPISEIPSFVASVRAAFDEGRTRSSSWRLKQLEGLVALVDAQEEAIVEALRQDLGKPALEAWAAELAYVRHEAESARRQLAGWMKPRRVRTPLVNQPGTSRVHAEPLGTVLVIAPWNYPFQLALAPVVGAVAAGNAVVLKPSEVAPATSALLARLLPQYLDPQCVRVIEGGIPETTRLLEQRFDHIFYTGNARVGRIVMRAAAEHLTPVTLELGGKSPCIVDRSADLAMAARRIVWGKFFNAGQTCVAPDYVLVHATVEEALVERMAEAVLAFYGEDPRESPDYGRVVNARHVERLEKLLHDGGRASVGGVVDAATRYIAPTILQEVDPFSPIMQEEIFGPLLPVLPIEDMDDAVAFVNARPKPLALYVFAEDGTISQEILRRTSSGGAVVNHVMMQLSVPDLPFGGVGESGMGAHHGKKSFDTFSHEKAVLERSTRFDPSLMYPPYTKQKRRWLRRLL